MSNRIYIPPEVRKYVFERDRYCCRHCGANKNLTIDHIIPLARGGTNDISNLQTLCMACNCRKRASYDRHSDRYWQE